MRSAPASAAAALVAREARALAVACARRAPVGARRAEEQQGDLHRCDPVHERVVGLPDDRPAAAGEPVDARQPPQRPIHVERAAEQPAGQRPQLAGSAGGRERHAVHMACDVEARVVDPLLAVHAAPEARQRVQAGVDVAPQRGDGGGRTFELQRPADVQGRLRGLEVKERCVEGAEAIWRGHACKKSAGIRFAKGSWGRAEEKEGAPWWDALLGASNHKNGPSS